MRFLACALLSLTVASSLSAQTSISAYDQGVAARRAGDAARAVTLLEQAVREDPKSSDALVQLGYALLALGRLDDADRAFAEALRLAPAYDDAKVGHALIAERRGEFERARALVATIAPDHEEGRALRQRLKGAGAVSRWTFDADASLTRVGAGQPDWHQLDLQLTRRMDDGSRLYGRIESARRFDLTDIYGEMRGERPVGEGGSVYLLAGGTPDAHFRPRWQIGGGGRLRLKGDRAPTILTLDARHADYRSGATTILNPGIEQYFAGGRAWVTAQSINLLQDGNFSSGWLARIDVLPTNDWRLFGGAANAPDAEQGIVTRTRSLFAGASVDLGKATGLRISVSRERPDLGGDRTGVSLGSTVRF